MSAWRLIRAVAAAGALFALALPAGASAQDVPEVISPLRVETDHNNVNLVTGKTTIEPPVLSVPAAPNLRFDRDFSGTLYLDFSGTLYLIADGIDRAD